MIRVVFLPTRCRRMGENGQHTTGVRETYNTQVTLQVEYHGRFGEPGIADSHNTVIDC